MSVKFTKEETFYIETDILFNGTVICSKNCEKFTFCLHNQTIKNPNQDDYDILRIPQEGCPVFGLNVGEFDIKISTEITKRD